MLEANLVGDGGGVQHRSGNENPAFASFTWERLLLSWNRPRRASKPKKGSQEKGAHRKCKGTQGQKSHRTTRSISTRLHFNPTNANSTNIY